VLDAMKHVTIGTSGHIDHGKSSLVRALTGTDPDRLQEEKVRGITIDLGFAHTMEDDIVLSFVDVPGHERFVRNMLAGVGGIDLVMLHVAADESVMPQTREHFDICRLLRVPAGLVVVTKVDLVDPDTVDVVRLEVEELVAGSFLEHAPILGVSSRTGAGITELRQALARLAAGVPERHPRGAPRLPIDRAFSIKGFGTVVTGTLTSGRISVDDELVLLPGGRAVKARGLHVHGSTQASARAGQRVAVNLAGVDVSDVTRGETLTLSDGVLVTRRVDVQLELLPSARPVRHGARVRFHQGTRELIGRVALAGAVELDRGATGYARIRLEAPAALKRGDRFIVRAYSPIRTIGGGVVLDPQPPRRGVTAEAVRSRFERIGDGTLEHEALMVMVEEAELQGFPLCTLAARVGVDAEAGGRIVGALQRSGHIESLGGLLLSATRLRNSEEVLLGLVRDYHASHPLEEGMPREELRSRAFGSAPAVIFEHVLSRLVREGRIVARDRVALAGHSLALTDEEARVRDEMVQLIGKAAFAPPDVAVLAGQIGAGRDVVSRVAAVLVRQKTLVRIGDLLFHQAALDRLKAEVRALKIDGTSDTIDVAVFKERYHLTRKYAIPLLEFLDRERVTRRVGERRMIL
jgi:selenocysteine-specific elongation factor